VEKQQAGAANTHLPGPSRLATLDSPILSLSISNMIQGWPSVIWTVKNARRQSSVIVIVS